MNPLLAAIKGASKVAQETTTSARKRMMESVLPSPQMAYGLGMGIGPMLQAIAAEMKKKDDKKDESKDQKATADNKAALAAKQQTRLLATQLSAMVSVLKDIKNIGLMQLRADQLKAFEERKSMFASKAGSKMSFGSDGETKSAKGDHGIFGGALGGTLLGSLAGALPNLLKLLVGGAAIYGIWEEIFDESTRRAIKSFFLGGENADKTLGEYVIDQWKKAFDEAPITTIVGTGLAAWATGLLGVLGVAGKVAWVGGKMIYNIGAFTGTQMAKPMTPTATPGVQAPLPSAAIPPVPPVIQSVGNEAKQLPGLQQPQGPVSPATPPSATGIQAAATGMLAKAGEMLSKGLTVLSRIAGGVGVVGTGLAAGVAAAEGKPISAGLLGTSALLSAGALGSALTGVGAPAAPFLAGGSLITGLLGTVASFLEGGNQQKTQQQTPQTEGPAPSATVPASRFSGGAPISRDETMQLIQAKFGVAGYQSQHIWAALANAARESGFNPLARNNNGKEDSVGIFQMNRKGGGLGTNYSVEQLQDPAFNTELLINALKTAELNDKGYFGKNARAFRNATSKEEAAEYLRRFLFGNGTEEQQMAGARRQQQINASLESGQFGRMPSLVASGTALAAAPQGFQPPASQISRSNVSGPDATNATMLQEITGLVNDLMKQVTGDINMIDQSDKSTNVSSSSGGGSGGAAHVVDTIRSSVTGIVYPSDAGFA